jgi:glutamate synthase (NADPH/NADH) large chain
VRELMAHLGFRTFEEMIGRADVLDMRAGIAHWKRAASTSRGSFHQPQMPADVARSKKEEQDHGLSRALDHQLIAQRGRPSTSNSRCASRSGSATPTVRSGAMLSACSRTNTATRALPEDTIHIAFEGIAGQSFGAFLARGITFELQGASNDYVGKGLSGGRIVVYPDPTCPAKPEENIVIGNTVMYGAIEGEAYFRGVAGRALLRAQFRRTAVVEGTGDHGCEYMTGGTVACSAGPAAISPAGMSGGLAYVTTPTARSRSAATRRW